MSSIAMSAAVTGAQAQQLRIDTISNNVANVNTDGYKRMEASFSDLFYINLKRAGILENAEAAPRPTGVQIGMGTRVIGTYRVVEQGPLHQTFHPLDIALKGPGYFGVTLPNNRIGYTRAGSFKLDSDRNIVTQDGNSLTTAISIPANVALEDVQIAENGQITVQDPANPAQNIEIGQLEIFTFPNESGLEAIGNNLLVETVGSGEAVAVDDLNGRFKQTFLEGSNVKAVEELTKLIEAQRAYELNTRVISTEDKILEATNNIK
ncbi:Flagellar basal-body rod protein FlgG [Candidatus Megaera venefica]|jgi:flagellar basal-body rod protein FlgG|uniref:Flagellar basal-body rod protein FlgG n=1 Tax=Candidatus Megaera venefica TaxID=2055910 RepID=A0ABU5NAX0_9RICK|nr:flagellar basal-body rod protein FlgG [Candidatus Megaera venefica]MEA0970335.1 Flagellar basal-body rod protein FlgG [Candidatus Megaera venefica]